VKRRPHDERERRLVAACARGDQEAWRRFCAQYQPLITAAAKRALVKFGVQDELVAQDAAAEVLAYLLKDDCRALKAFEGRSSLATWLRVVARRRAIRSQRRVQPDVLAEPGALRAGGPSPSEEAHVSERQQVVRQQLAKLPDRDRLALQLFYEGGRSYQQVAEALDLPPERIGTLLARARERLAKKLFAPGGRR
jgi:RNA polymerase sigma-70 factor (ECF subfamily)